MRFSIRSKIFAAISGLIIMYVFVSWILNDRFLPTYYYYNKKNFLIKSYQTIDKLYHGDPEDVALELEKLEQLRGLHVTIVDKEFAAKYDSFPRNGAMFFRSDGETFMQRRPPQEPTFNVGTENLQGKKIIVEKSRSSRLNTEFINLFAVLNNGDYIMISTPMAAIEESAEISNRFFLFTGLFVIGSGLIMVYMLANKLTKPILDMNQIAQKMAVLDFSEKYPVKSRDEIGELGESINSLSGQLKKSISELKDANQQLTIDIEHKKKIDELRKELISNVSHELKTPIALVQGYAEGLKINVNEDEENKNYYCDVIIDEAHKMNRLVSQLLDLSQIEAGEVDLDKSNFELVPLIEQVIRKNSLIFKENAIIVSLERVKNINVYADYYRIEQVLINYLNNAINHVNAEKQISIRIECIEDKARVFVFNSGEHITEENIDKIWLSFYKIDKARTRAYGGTGLGLSIVKAIQEAHHNGYGINNVDDGVEFWFDIDIAAASDTL